MGELIRQQAQAPRRVSITQRGRAVAVSRAADSRSRGVASPGTPELEVRDSLQRLALEWPAYG